MQQETLAVEGPEGLPISRVVRARTEAEEPR